VDVALPVDLAMASESRWPLPLLLRSPLDVVRVVDVRGAVVAFAGCRRVDAGMGDTGLLRDTQQLCCYLGIGMNKDGRDGEQNGREEGRWMIDGERLLTFDLSAVCGRGRLALLRGMSCLGDVSPSRGIRFISSRTRLPRNHSPLRFCV
jgi:hypothetical protein